MLDSLVRFSIHNRWLVIVITLAAAGLGVISMRRLPIDAVPDITNNQVQINTLAPALSPVEIETQVTFPVETALAGIPGLHATRSLSRNGFSQVTAVFDDAVDIYFARQQVSERLAEAAKSLPAGAEPAMGPIATGLGEIYMYTVEFESPRTPSRPGEPGWQEDGVYLTPEGTRLASAVEQYAYLREVQDWIIRPQLKSVKDIAGVDAIGGFVKQYHVRPDPMKLAAYGLTFSQVIEALERNNTSAGAGTLDRKGEGYTVRAAGRIEKAEELEDIPVGSRGGVPVRVRDIVSAGGVGIGPELRTGSASRDGEECVVGTAIMLIGANSRTVAAAADAKMEQIRKSLPRGVAARTVLNRTTLVDASINTVKWNLAEGAALVVLVLFLLLGNIRAALITALIIPAAMLITFTGMVQTRIPANLLSLGAIDFGMLVDGGVIIVENCLRRLAQRQHREGRTLSATERLDEILTACRELARPAVFGGAIIIAVFANVLLLTGIEGRMFRPMALTMIFALAASFILALTFIPALVTILIPARVKEKENVLIRWAKRAYQPTLRLALRARWAVVGAGLAAFAASAFLFTRLGQEFVPTLDEQNFAMHAMRMPSTSLAQSQAMQIDVERAIRGFPEVQVVFSKTGTAELASDPMPPNVSDTFIILKPRPQWRSERELDALIAGLEEKTEHPDPHADGEEHEPRPQGHKGKLLRLLELELADLPGNNYEFTQPIQMRFNELIAGVRGDVAVKVFGDDPAQLTAAAARIAAVLQSIPGAADVKTEQTEGLPTLSIEPDRRALARYGLSVRDVHDVIAVAVGGAEAGTIFEGDRRFDIIVRLPESRRTSLDELERLPVPLPAAGDDRPGFVPLGVVARVRPGEGVNQISREDGKRRVVVQANIRGRDLGSFIAEAQARVAAVKLPPGSWLAWGGQFENLVAARERLTIAVPLSLTLILLLLLGLFKSLKDALLVFSGVPLALTGGILALWLRDMPFSISAAVGFIALSGVAVLNGVVMVGLIAQLRAEGLAATEAILRGCLTRLRPVLMTALVAAVGFLPMALARGTGAEVQRPLATVVIGGIISSTLLTLVVLPALYRIFTRRQTTASPPPVTSPT